MRLLDQHRHAARDAGEPARRRGAGWASRRSRRRAGPRRASRSAVGKVRDAVLRGEGFGRRRSDRRSPRRRSRVRQEHAAGGAWPIRPAPITADACRGAIVRSSGVIQAVKKLRRHDRRLARHERGEVHALEHVAAHVDAGRDLGQHHALRRQAEHRALGDVERLVAARASRSLPEKVICSTSCTNLRHLAVARDARAVPSPARVLGALGVEGAAEHDLAGVLGDVDEAARADREAAELGDVDVALRRRPRRSRGRRCRGRRRNRSRTARAHRSWRSGCARSRTACRRAACRRRCRARSSGSSGRAGRARRRAWRPRRGCRSRS